MSKYKTILQSNKDELHSLYEIANQDSWKPIYHIHPPFGLMNDLTVYHTTMMNITFLSVVSIWSHSWNEALGACEVKRPY